MTGEAEHRPESGDEEAGEGKSSLNQLESSYYSLVGRTMADGRLMIGQDIEIFPTKECSAFASFGTSAYEANDRRQSSAQFALICGRAGVPRVTIIGSYRGLRNPNIMKLIDAGVVDWGAEGRQRFTLIFEKPRGQKLLNTPDGKPYHIHEDRIVSSFIGPAVTALAAFRNIDIVHGAINAENIYVASEGGVETIVLGECLSSAPSWRQHPLYETASRAVAQPDGRGPGTIKDDLYALGMCVAMVARGENFLAGKTPRQIIYEKVEQGSYASIMGRERIPPAVSEFLRGVLNDDEGQRWDIDDALRWLEGRRLSPKQPRVILKAARPLVMHDQKYWDLRSVAQVFSENIGEAAVEIEKDQFELWLKRSFDDKSLKARLDKIWKKEKSVSRERLVSNVCMMIDPFGPLRYKGLAIFPGGLGTALAGAMARGEDIQAYGEILSQQLFSNWISQIFDDLPDAPVMTGLLEKCRNALGQKMPGYGIERVLYMLNAEVACMSTILKNYFVLVPGSLLLALEDLSKHADRPAFPLDRHMISFISVREPKMIDPHLGYVNSHSKGNQVIGVVRTLAAIQRRFAVGPVPGVTNWLISLTGPVIDMLRDHDLRQELSRRVNKLKDAGNLTVLRDLIDDPRLIREDMQRFARAQQEYRMLTQEKNAIENQLRKRKNIGKATGRQLAMLVSSVLATLAMVGYLVLRLTGVGN